MDHGRGGNRVPFHSLAAFQMSATRLRTVKLLSEITDDYFYLEDLIEKLGMNQATESKALKNAREQVRTELMPSFDLIHQFCLRTPGPGSRRFSPGPHRILDATRPTTESGQAKNKHNMNFVDVDGELLNHLLFKPAFAEVIGNFTDQSALSV